MNFIIENGADVKDGKAKEFQQWLQEHEDEIREATPDGVEYIGTFWTIFGSDVAGGSCRVLWGADEYAGLDVWVGAMEAGGRFAELIAQHADFMDQRNEAASSNAIRKSVTAATVWGE